MDDQTEVPAEDEKVFRVRYTDTAFPGPRYTRPVTLVQARARRTMLNATPGISDVEIVGLEDIITEQASAFAVDGEADERAMLKRAEQARAEAKERVDEDVDASLGEPTVLPRHPEDEITDEDARNVTAPVLDTWSQKQNRQKALDHAMKLATIPMGGMIVQTGGPSAEKVIENARLFLAFLNEEGPSA